MKKLPEDLAVKLLDASADFPSGSGFDVSIDDVAKLADVPRATLYYYFSGKDDLVQFYLNDLMNRTRSGIEKAASAEGSPTERLEAVMRAMIEAFATYPKMCLELPKAIRAADDYETLMANMERSILTPIRELLMEGRGAGSVTFPDVRTAADMIAGAIHMASAKTLVATGEIDVDEIAGRVIPLLLDGLKSR